MILLWCLFDVTIVLLRLLLAVVILVALTWCYTSCVLIAVCCFVWCLWLGSMVVVCWFVGCWRLLFGLWLCCGDDVFLLV